MGTKSASVGAWLNQSASATTPGMIEALRDLLASLAATDGIALSVGRNLTVSIVRKAKTLSILGLSTTGDVDVPWSIDAEKDWFKPFAQDLAEAIPSSILYETPRMWRVDGCGTAKGQITIDELVGAADVVLVGIQKLLRRA